MSQISWEIVQGFIQNIFGKDFKLNVKNVILGTCKKKGLSDKDRKFFSCVNAQVIALLASMYYKQARVGQERMIRMMNSAINTCICLGLNKGYRTSLKRGPTYPV